MAVNKQRLHTYFVERFNLKKVKDVEGKEQYRVEISKRLASLENSDTVVDIDRD
jgi:hypothetical protein